MTFLCAAIMVEDAAAALADAAEAKRQGADLVEYRLDALFQGEGDEEGEREALRVCAQSPLPCIATCRLADEGGEYGGDEMARVSLLDALGVSDRPPRYIDVELSAYTSSANLRQKINLAVQHEKQLRDVHASLILSAHDAAGRPGDLIRRLSRMRRERAAAVQKIAYRARSLRDNLELFDILAEREKPTIALGMGEFGLMSRVLAPKFGGFLTFASLREQEVTAPGQPTIRELLDVYRFRSIGPRTGVYGVVGWPVAHSLSPIVHNAAFAGAAHDGVYLPLPVPPEWEHFKATIPALVEHPRLDFRGASVTAPHKQHLVRLAQEMGWKVGERAQRCGAANTLIVEEGGAVRVEDTDGEAAAACLAQPLGELAGRRVALLGAGGVAKAIALALTERGAGVTVFARRRERAEALASSLGGALGGGVEAKGWDQRESFAGDAAINCTPVGLEGGPDERGTPSDPRAMASLAPGAVFLETVYRPRVTPWLAAAREAGFRTVPGSAMFVRQAEAQAAMWTGKRPPAGLFERLVRAGLAGDSGNGADGGDPSGR